MKNNHLMNYLILLVLFMTGFISKAQHETIPITSSSGSAVELYYEATAAMENAELMQGEMLLQEALKKDPEFFMGLFQMAINNLYLGNHDKFKKCAEAAFISCCASSEGEKLLQQALKQLYNDPEADVTDLGKKLLQLYPEDKLVYYTQLTFQSLQKDYSGIQETCKALLKITDNPAPAYNILGYNYMRLEDFKAAEKAFDKYIELLPNHPNPYDSKGDFYMEVKDYPNAYSSFITANRLNESWSYGKAMEAKKLMEAKTPPEVEIAPNIQGAWNLVYMKSVSDGSVAYSFPGKLIGTDMKIWSNNHFACVGRFTMNGELLNNYVGGTYTLNGNRYQENIEYHANQTAVGAKPQMLLELKGDTLVQTWPVDAGGNFDKKNYSVEKYVRLDGENWKQ